MHFTMTAPTNIVELRQATLDDVDAVVDISTAAMPADPQYDYRFPLRKQYPKEHRIATRKTIARFLDVEAGQYTVMLAEMAALDDPRRVKPVAFCVFETANLNLEHGVAGCRKASESSEQRLLLMKDRTDAMFPDPKPPLEPRIDGNTARMKAFKEGLDNYQRQFFDDVYGKDYFFLVLLATHPHYQRHGAGSRLVNWGVRIARERDIRLGLFASPMGKPLYQHFGFHEIGSAVVRVEGEVEFVAPAIMLFEPRSATGSAGG